TISSSTNGSASSRREGMRSSSAGERDCYGTPCAGRRKPGGNPPFYPAAVTPPVEEGPRRSRRRRRGTRTRIGDPARVAVQWSGTATEGAMTEPTRRRRFPWGDALALAALAGAAALSGVGVRPHLGLALAAFVAARAVCGPPWAALAGALVLWHPAVADALSR